MIKEPGIYQISNEEYHADPSEQPSLSRGIIHELLTKTPAHVFASNKRLNPRCIETDEKEDKFDIGKAAHALFLEGLDTCEVVYADDWRKKEAKEAREVARLAGKVPLLEGQYERVKEMVNAAHRQLRQSELAIKDLYDEGKSEQSLFWKETEYVKDRYDKPTDKVIWETWFRIRLDWWKNNQEIIIDYKTADSADPDVWSGRMVEHGCDIQHSLYRNGAYALTGKKPKLFFFVQETKPPYLCSLIGLPPQFQEMGEEKVKYGVHIWQDCLRNGWPGYPQRICYVEPKPWAIASWEAFKYQIENGENQ